MSELITDEDWAKHRRDVMQIMPDKLSGLDVPDVLLSYQKELLEATATNQVVVTDKSRRIGATWAIGSDAVLTSAKKRNESGMDTLYLGYNQDMAREFIDVCAMWAKCFSSVASEVQEFIFIDQDKKGDERSIKAFRISFASGFEIVALSSRPRSLRGRQGYVILDEFAFHDDAEELLKAALALLIWGGKVLVISTHNGVDNPFNQLIEDIRAGKRPGKVVRTTFDDALEAGLYQRICFLKGKDWSVEEEAKWRSEIRAHYQMNAGEELDCIPAMGTGVYLTGALIETCMSGTGQVLTFKSPEGFELRDDDYRVSYMNDWLEQNILPELEKLDQNLFHSYGFDFARSGDLSVFMPIAEERSLTLKVPFILQMRNVPFRQQEQLLFYIVDRLPRFRAGKHDARGNGQAIAEYAQDRYGERVEAVMLSQSWYLDNMPKMYERFSDRTIILPKHSDIKSDFQQIKMVRGIPKVPDNVKTKGSDGGQRHGDAAIAGVLAVAAAGEDIEEFEYITINDETLGKAQMFEAAKPAGFIPNRSGGIY